MPRLGATGAPRAAERRRPVAIGTGTRTEVKMSYRGPSEPRTKCRAQDAGQDVLCAQWLALPPSSRGGKGLEHDVA